MSLLFLVIAIVFVLPANWFYNGGSAGPTLLLYLIAAFYFSFLLADYPKSRYFFTMLIIVIPAGLVFSETSLQPWIYSYPNVQAKQLDIWVSYAVTVGMSIFIMKMYGKRYRLQREKSERLAQQLRVLAETDSLTKLYNRSAFAQLYNNINDKSDYSLAILDLDNFKLLNDTYGHQCGDEVLVTFAKRLRTINEDEEFLVARYGGEEFLILLKQPLQKAFSILDAFRQNLNLYDPQAKKVTFSAGLVPLTQNETLLSAIHRADIKLYKAKSQGRNCGVSTLFRT
ncbi:GGDEF domain-containing protein [Thiomicrorhabdus aquaedulcis]|uniref:GGDEF domain-containing protein n=1 Tax=Thiomicrorhabdus aquaedulcis TaxID=2211106 RepID=UPI000FDBBCAC|nr:GGDEF domain-containing protein [Thiomicrorhabdus aquaedulcis]